MLKKKKCSHSAVPFQTGLPKRKEIYQKRDREEGRGKTIFAWIRVHLPAFKQLNFDPTSKPQCICFSSVSIPHLQFYLAVRAPCQQEEENSAQSQCLNLRTQTFTSQTLTYWKKNLLNFELSICNRTRKTNTQAGERDSSA